MLCADVAEEPLRRATRLGLETRLLEPDGPWPLEDASFDAVWAGEVIEHVLDTAAWLSELRRVLRSGGRLLLSTPDHGPCGASPWPLLPGAFERHFDPRSDHLRFYTSRSIAHLLAEFGFEAIRVRGSEGSPERGPRCSSALAGALLSGASRSAAQQRRALTQRVHVVVVDSIASLSPLASASRAIDSGFR